MVNAIVSNDAVKVKDAILPPKCPDNLFQPHFRVGFVGSSGSGKTTLCINLLRSYQENNVFDRYILISPSGCTDFFTGIKAEPKWNAVKIDREYRELTGAVIQEIQDEQKQLILEYKEYETDLKLYLKWKRGGKLDLHELMRLYDKYDFEKPISPNGGKDRYPTVCIIADDCTSSCQSKALADFISKSRHSLASVFLLVQHMYQIARATRKSLSGLVIFRTSDKKIRKELFSEYASADMDDKEFEEILGRLENRSDFLCIDLNAMEKDRRYRTKF